MPPAEQVQLLDLDSGGVLPAVPAERNARIECPHIARDDFDVDFTVVIRDRSDGSVVEVARRSQQPLGFVHQPLRISIAAAEQELAPDDLFACGDVQAVGEAEECVSSFGSSRSKMFWFAILISPNVAPALSSSSSDGNCVRCAEAGGGASMAGSAAAVPCRSRAINSAGRQERVACLRDFIRLCGHCDTQRLAQGETASHVRINRDARCSTAFSQLARRPRPAWPGTAAG